MDIGMKSEFKVRITPKDDKAVYSQSLPMPIHQKEDLIVELALMHKYGIITVLSFSKYASPIFAQRKTSGKLRLLVDSGKAKPWSEMIILTRITHSALCQTQHNTWQGNLYSANLTTLRLIIVCGWRINRQWKGLFSIFLAEPLPTKDLHKVSVDLSLFFQASCTSTWT